MIDDQLGTKATVSGNEVIWRKHSEETFIFTGGTRLSSWGSAENHYTVHRRMLTVP